MTDIIRNRTIRPSSRLETSKSYKIDTKNVTKDDTLIVNIDHETNSFKKSYCFNGADVANKDSISFRVYDNTTHINISWNGAQPIETSLTKTAEKPAEKRPTPTLVVKKTFHLNKDEHYVLDLCDKVLGLTSLRQHKFDFLLGDLNKNGRATKLPVDSYYKELNLVIEYCEKQHSESVSIFDKTDRMTVSGVHRGEQRKIYDERRRQILPKHNIQLIEISYSDFKYDKQKQIIRNPKLDEEVIRQKLTIFFKK